MIYNESFYLVVKYLASLNCFFTKFIKFNESIKNEYPKMNGKDKNCDR